MIGIYLMGFVILVAGIGVFGMSIAYAIRPTEQRLALMRPLSLAAIFAATCSSSVGFASAFKNMADGGVVGPEAVRVLRDYLDWEEHPALRRRAEGGEEDRATDADPHRRRQIRRGHEALDETGDDEADDETGHDHHRAQPGVLEC